MAKLTELPNIQYTGMDYDSVIKEIRQIITDNPSWEENWSEFRDSEAGTMLMSLFAWITDNMTSRQDLLFNEMFIGTAQSNLNKMRHLRQIGYVPKMAHAAMVPLTINIANGILREEIELVPQMPSNSGPLDYISRESVFKIKSSNGATGPNRTIGWEIIRLRNGKPSYKEGIFLSPGKNEYTETKDGDKIYAIQGETKHKYVEISTNNGFTYSIVDKNIASNSMQIYISKTARPDLKKVPLKEVRSFVSAEALLNDGSIPYMLEVNDNGTYKIRFANTNIANKEKLIEAGTQIEIFYRICDGSLGNIAPGIIDFSTKYSSENATYSAQIINNNIATGGADSESLDLAVKNGPLQLTTMDRAVTPDDYDLLLKNNTNIYKSKTYTSSNQPKNFKDYYGRYLNPQEAFSFVMLNKNHKNLPSDKYNYFPWVTTIKEPRINEKYIFDDGGYNEEASYSQILHNATFNIDSEKSQVFSNATIINIGDKFNKKVLINGEYNKDLKLKITNGKTDKEYFPDILFNILGKNNGNNYLTLENNNIEVSDNAKFISKSSYLRGDEQVPINIIDSRYITFVIDNVLKQSIDLMSVFIDTEKGEQPLNEAYLLWDNDPSANNLNKDISYNKDGAKFRPGIVQIINESINSALLSDNEEFKYINKTSRQYFGLQKSSKTSIISNSLEAFETIKFSLQIKDNIYLFDMPKSGENWGSIISFVNFLNTCFLKGTNVKKIDGSSISEGELSNYEAICISSNNNKIIKYDLCIVNRNKDESVLVNKKLSISDPIAAKLIIGNEDYKGLFSFIKENSPSEEYTKPRTTIAAEYNNLASMIDDGSRFRFMIKSPLTGKDSSIFFEEKEKDFGKNILNIEYNSLNHNSVISYGIRRVYLLKNNSTGVSININGKEILTDAPAKIGNVIFENSCMFNDYDIKNLFSSYKLQTKNKLLLGTFNNFYYTGNSRFDNEVIDENLSGILGQVMYSKTLENGKKVYRIDPKKSKFDIRFTKEMVDTNSLFAIKSDLGVVGDDYVSFETGDITEDITITDTNEKLCINIDGERFDVPLGNVNNNISLLNEIKKRINFLFNDDPKSVKNIRNNFDSIFRTSFFNSKRLSINSFSNNNGFVSFYLDKKVTNNNVDKIYKNLFGTNITNPDFYFLYPESIISRDNSPENIEYISENEFFYKPTENKDLTLKFRRLSEETAESSQADYHIEVSEISQNDETGEVKYNFYLVRDEEGRFKDSSFYIHLINDKSYTSKELDERMLLDYMKKYRISGIEQHFLQPYFKTYDLKVRVVCDFSIESATVIKKEISDAIEKLCGIDNAQINGTISKSDITTTIKNIGPEIIDTTILYFGPNLSDETTNISEKVGKIKSDFFEVNFINDTNEDLGKGLILELKDKDEIENETEIE